MNERSKWCRLYWNIFYMSLIPGFTISIQKSRDWTMIPGLKFLLIGHAFMDAKHDRASRSDINIKIYLWIFILSLVSQFYSRVYAIVSAILYIKNVNRRKNNGLAIITGHLGRRLIVYNKFIDHSRLRKPFGSFLVERRVQCVVRSDVLFCVVIPRRQRHCSLLLCSVRSIEPAELQVCLSRI